jgi:hypothetical protein
VLKFVQRVILENGAAGSGADEKKDLFVGVGGILDRPGLPAVRGDYVTSSRSNGNGDFFSG